jgi:peptide/nickel transport system permease protein
MIEPTGKEPAGNNAQPRLRAARHQSSRREQLADFGRFIKRNPNLAWGILLLSALVIFAVVGAITTDRQQARPLSAPPLLAPSVDYPFGTDRLGRNLFATVVAGIPLTFQIGLLAGLIGVGIGTILGFFAAYYGGMVDSIISSIVDVGLTIPGLMILIILGISFSGRLTVGAMALIVGVIAWLHPTRVIRSQVLTMKERPYVEVARLSGMSNLEIIFLELIPNLLPFLAASLVAAVSSAVLASIGLEALGLGPIDSPTLGMTIYWAILDGAVINRWWWWWMPPIAAISILFLGLFLLSMGLDEIANPRVRERV